MQAFSRNLECETIYLKIFPITPKCTISYNSRLYNTAIIFSLTAECKIASDSSLISEKNVAEYNLKYFR